MEFGTTASTTTTPAERRHGQSPRRRRPLAARVAAAAATLVCLSSANPTIGSSRHIPASRHASGGSNKHKAQRFPFLSPVRSGRLSGGALERRFTEPPPPTRARQALPSSTSSTRLYSSSPDEDNNNNNSNNDIPLQSSSSSGNTTLSSSTRAYVGGDEDDDTRVTTTSYFRFPSETAPGQQQRQEAQQQPRAPTVVAKPQKQLKAPLSQAKIQTLFVVSLMGIAGFVEGFCLRRHGCFPNLMTGTILKLAESLGSFRLRQAGVHAAMVASYAAGGWVLARWKEASTGGNQTKQDKASVLGGVAVLSTVLFALSDLSSVVGTATPSLRLPLMAAAFGIVNAGTVDVGAGVTFAMTSHVTRAGQAVLAPSPKRNTRGADGFAASNAETPTPAHVVSARGLLVFWSAALAANLVCGVLERGGVWGSLLAKIPMGTALAVVYGSLFRWYTGASARATKAAASAKRS